MLNVVLLSSFIHIQRTLCADQHTITSILFTEGKLSKEFKSIQLRNNSLTVDYVTDADEGYYMCTANNGIGAGLKKIIHINVNGKLKCGSDRMR